MINKETARPSGAEEPKDGAGSRPLTRINLPEWNDIAEVVRMPCDLDISVTLLDGRRIDMTSADLRQILNRAGISA